MAISLEIDRGTLSNHMRIAVRDFASAIRYERRRGIDVDIMASLANEIEDLYIADPDSISGVEDHLERTHHRVN